MGNVNMEADQIHVRDNSHKTWRTVADALKALEASGEGVAEDITELYTRDASRASKDDIANEFDAETLYHTGDYVYYDGTLFKFTANHSGDWDPADVVIAQIGQNISTLESRIEAVETMFAQKKKSFTPQKTIAGSYTLYQDSDLKNKVVTGFGINGVTNYNCSVVSVNSNEDGMFLLLKNNGNTDFTPMAVEVFYIG